MQKNLIINLKYFVLPLFAITRNEISQITQRSLKRCLH